MSVGEKYHIFEITAETNFLESFEIEIVLIWKKKKNTRVLEKEKAKLRRVGRRDNA